MAKSSPDLFESLRAQGLRKRAAKTISQAAERAEKTGKSAPKTAHAAVAELRGFLDDVEDRLHGGPAKRTAAAKKAANTRKRNAAKRSSAAKKAAATRARA